MNERPLSPLSEAIIVGDVKLLEEAVGQHNELLEPPGKGPSIAQLSVSAAKQQLLDRSSACRHVLLPLRRAVSSRDPLAIARYTCAAEASRHARWMSCDIRIALAMLRLMGTAADAAQPLLRNGGTLRPFLEEFHTVLPLELRQGLLSECGASLREPLGSELEIGEVPLPKGDGNQRAWGPDGASTMDLRFAGLEAELAKTRLEVQQFHVFGESLLREMEGARRQMEVLSTKYSGRILDDEAELLRTKEMKLAAVKAEFASVEAQTQQLHSTLQNDRVALSEAERAKIKLEQVAGPGENSRKFGVRLHTEEAEEAAERSLLELHESQLRARILDFTHEFCRLARKRR